MTLRRHIRREQGGFTLLELLVTVGIMAAIAGTATLALQDTTARASAAAHVAMMDELNEGIMTYRALPNNNNSYPTNFDSGIAVTADPGAGTALAGSVPTEVLGIDFGDATTAGDVAMFELPAGFAQPLIDGGIDQLRYIDLSLDGDGGDSPFTCADTTEIIASRANAFVPGNIFQGGTGNGCGFSRGIEDGDEVLIWTGGNERVLGSGNVELDTTTAGGVTTINATAASVGAKVLMAVGAGPSSNLFDASELGGMSSVPVYRHVSNLQYNRYFVLFEIGEVVDISGTPTLVAADQVVIAGVVDGAGDTKEEELGEWDGTRNTI
ncbi:MAG: prepilin-type N-terminal cleavage/methylation domain-containing protein [Pseudomonadota bacterium]